MPRKKPFSVKQKKQQLQEKRRRKQDPGVQDGGRNVYPEEEEEQVESPRATGSSDDVKRINEQPVSQAGGKFNPNKYRQHFFKHSDEEVRKSRSQSRQPYQPLPEEALEVNFDVETVIDIPHRPTWDYMLSKHHLEQSEERYFRGYLDQLFSDYSPEELSYVELNLETWRQLWRVLEISDMFLLITDIRHPSLHFSPALYKYITEDLSKSVILVINKVDLAPPSLVVAWQYYFKEKFPLVEIVCFTSFPKDKAELETISTGTGKVVFKKRRRGTYRALGPRELYRACTGVVKGQVDLSSWAAKIEQDQAVGYHDDSDSDGETDVVPTDLDSSYHKHERYKGGVLTIGCIGYPNVGKSSIMNGLMGKKVVSVSRTPGHTKHFQTIFLTPTVRMCDSPGLVFPARVNRNMQILGGIYPIAQVRDPVSALGYIAQRLDLPRLLHIKQLNLDAEDQPLPWSASDICDSWADKRGFQTARTARLDTYRAANNLLRMAVEGRLCLCLRPMGYTKHKDMWDQHPSTQELADLQIKYRRPPDEAGTDSDSDNGESGAGEEDSEGESEEEQSIASHNPFAMLGED